MEIQLVKAQPHNHQSIYYISEGGAEIQRMPLRVREAHADLNITSKTYCHLEGIPQQDTGHRPDSIGLE
jgi:hypothetical protein